MAVKSERLRKLERELHDLEQWLKLGLVPKKDLDKHKEEMRGLQGKIREEEEKLQYLKEQASEEEEFTMPRRGPARSAYGGEMATLPDVEMAEESSVSDTAIEMETETAQQTYFEEREEAEGGGEEEEDEAEEEEEEDPFSERNRWRRGMSEQDQGIMDPDADRW
jgi:hypothetical protein